MFSMVIICNILQTITQEVNENFMKSSFIKERISEGKL